MRGASLRGREPFLASRTVATKKRGIVGCALALGGCRHLRTRDVRLRRRRGLIRLGAPPLGATTAITPALGLAFLLTVGGLSILPRGAPPPPPPRRRATFRATVARLRTRRPEELLASLEQTPPPPRPPPTCPLTNASWTANLRWAQGSSELPTAKPRTGSLLLRPEALSHRPSWPTRTLQPTTDRAVFPTSRAPSHRKPPVSV